MVRFYLLCSLRRIPKLSAIRTLRVVVHCKRILNNSCWQSYLLLRVAKSHYFITNLIKPNRLFKPQFEEPLINEFLAFHFFFLNKCKFLRDILITEGKKKIFRVNTRTARDVIVRLVLSLIKGEGNLCLLTGFAAACWQQKNVEPGDSLLFCGSACPCYKPWPRARLHSLSCPPPPISMSSHYQKFHERQKFHWLHLRPHPELAAC